MDGLNQQTINESSFHLFRPTGKCHPLGRCIKANKLINWLKYIAIEFATQRIFRPMVLQVILFLIYGVKSVSADMSIEYRRRWFIKRNCPRLNHHTSIQTQSINMGCCLFVMSLKNLRTSFYHYIDILVPSSIHVQYVNFCSC